MYAINKKLIDELEREFQLYQEAIENPLEVYIGIVSVEGNLLRTIDYDTLEEVDEPPTIYLAEKFERIIYTDKRFVILIGGRGSGKSVGQGRLTIADMVVNKYSYFCLREFQKSIKDSVHSLLKAQVKNINESHFEILDKEIRTANAVASFAGIARSPDSVKSAYNFLRYWVEEAQSLSEESLRTLTPTARAKDTNALPNQSTEAEENQARIIFTANPASSEDPFSKRFINPFIDKLDENGIYEDDLHLVVKMNYSDNPWFYESGLEEERAWDEEHLDSALYEHIWEGAFNDSIENALIKANWFDACVDAHLKLKWNNPVQRRATHDPSDNDDAKALCLREGNIIVEITDRKDLDVNEGSDWAVQEALEFDADVYEWDVGGLGASLRKDVNTTLENTNIEVHQFSGQGSVDKPNAIYQPSGADNIKKQKTIKEVCRNLRAQCYLKLRDRVYKTYRAVIFGEMYDPSLLISFSSDCQKIRQLRSELCRIPIKPTNNDTFELYTKREMRDKFKLKSPNLADAVMMSERNHTKSREDRSTHEVQSRENYWDR